MNKQLGLKRQSERERLMTRDCRAEAVAVVEAMDFERGCPFPHVERTIFILHNN